MNSIARGCTQPLCFSYGRSILALSLKRNSASPHPVYFLLRLNHTARSSCGTPTSIRSPARAKLCSNEFSTMAESQTWWSPINSPKDKDLEAADLEIKPMDASELSEDDEALLTRRIHILGIGSIGTLVAHSLKCLPNPPPITLLMHRPEMYEQFKEGDRILRLVNKKTDINDEATRYDVDLLERDGESHFWHYIPDTPEGKDQEPSNPLTAGELMENGEIFIYTLIVTVKGPATVSALKAIKHRVDSRTTILFMQNGLGQIDALNSQVFTDPETRPTYMLGIISHGAYMQGPFAVVHAGFGSVALGIHRDTDKYPLPPRNADTDISELPEDERRKMYPTDKQLYSNLSARYLLRTLTRSPILACAPFPYLDLLQLQLEKLVMNCVLNPTTALLDIKNGLTLNNIHLNHAQRLLVAEISLVIRSLPELEGVPNVRLRFSARRLEGLFKAIAKKTAENSSSMREDVRNLKETEIDYLNGYIVRRGEEQGIKCVLNYLIMELIKGKSASQLVSEPGRDQSRRGQGSSGVSMEVQETPEA